MLNSIIPKGQFAKAAKEARKEPDKKKPSGLSCSALEIRRCREEANCHDHELMCMNAIDSKLWLNSSLADAESESQQIRTALDNGDYRFDRLNGVVIVGASVISAAAFFAHLKGTRRGFLLQGTIGSLVIAFAQSNAYGQQQAATPAATPSATASGTAGTAPAEPPSQQDILRRMYGLATVAEENRDAAIKLKQRMVAAGERQGKRFIELQKLEGVQKENGELIKLIGSGQAEVDKILLEVTTGLQDLVAKTKCLVEREKKLVCWLKYLDCRLRGLACAIRAAIRRAFIKGFIIGFILGLGLGIGLAGAGGGAGAMSVGFF